MGLLQVFPPLVFLPEIEGEGDEQHGDEGSDAEPDLQPQSDDLAGGGASRRQRHAFAAQFWFIPHVQRFLKES